MSSTSEPAHLNNHHRNTLRQIFQDPVSHNIEWHAVVSLLEAIASVVEQRDDMVAVTVGSGTEFFDAPAHKENRHADGCRPAPDASRCRIRTRW
jgi:signal transduction histidine kinase